MKIDNTHTKDSGNKPKPEVFYGPELLEVHNVLELLVMLINQWNKFIDEAGKVWSWNVSPYNAAKFIF